MIYIQDCHIVRSAIGMSHWLTRAVLRFGSLYIFGRLGYIFGRLETKPLNSALSVSSSVLFYCSSTRTDHLRHSPRKAFSTCRDLPKLLLIVCWFWQNLRIIINLITVTLRPMDQTVLSGTCNSIFSFENASAFWHEPLPNSVTCLVGNAIVLR